MRGGAEAAATSEEVASEREFKTQEMVWRRLVKEEIKAQGEDIGLLVRGGGMGGWGGGLGGRGGGAPGGGGP
jgi:hypothetical protein